jgi:biofilm PGA synthesis lipoprotein PgaB
VLLSFDDGFRSTYDVVFPELKRRRAPAVVALVGRWMEPEGGTIQFGDQPLARQRLMSWQQVRELSRSGLVEVASHTYDLHHDIPANPQGDAEPATSSRLHSPAAGYESEAAYRRRLGDDLRHNNELLARQLGRRPRVIVWPYGRYNATAAAVADGVGLSVGLTLDDGPNRPSVPLTALRRELMLAEMGDLDGLRTELAVRRDDLGDASRARKVMHVDLDNIHDPDPAQSERNLRLLLERIRAMGVNTVYLQAFADPDGDGAADAVYFPNRHLPMRADLFNHVAWEIRTRTPVRRVYAWMPALAWTLPADHPAAGLKVVTQPSTNGHFTMGYPRLSPFEPQAMAVVREIYEDLSRHATFDGLLFHDDVTLNDYEDVRPAALRQYRRWGLPPDPAAIRADDRLMARWITRKTETLDRLTTDLAELVRRNQPQLRTARNLYAQVVLNPHAEAWTSQSLDTALALYDFTAVEAMPYMEQARDPEAFLTDLVEAVKRHPHGLERVVFELQSTDWHTHRDLPSAELAGQMALLYQQGVHHLGYYPDNQKRGTPDPELIRPVLTAHSSAPLLESAGAG